MIGGAVRRPFRRPEGSGRLPISLILLSSICLPSVYACPCWTPVDPGLPGFGRLSAKNGVLYALTDSTVVASSDRGDRWRPVGPELPGLAEDLVVAGAGMFVRSAKYGSSRYVYAFRNGDSAWIPSDAGFPADSSFWVESLAAVGDTVLAGTSNGIYASYDSGSKWTPIGQDIREMDAPDWFHPASLDVLDIFVDGSTLYLSLLQKATLRGTLGGKLPAWKMLGLEYPIAMARNGGFLFSSGQGFRQADGMHPINRSADSGLTWEAADKGLPDPSAYRGQGLAVAYGHLFAGIKRGNGPGEVWVSDDNGSSWKTISSGLPNEGSASEPAPVLVAVEDILFADMGTKGVWRFFVRVLPTGLRFPDPLPEGSRFSPIRNGEGTVSFQLGKKERANLTLHDPDGRFLARLFTGLLPAGTHTVPFSLGSRRGAYLLRLQYAGTTAAHRLLLP